MHKSLRPKRSQTTFHVERHSVMIEDMSIRFSKKLRKVKREIRDWYMEDKSLWLRSLFLDDTTYKRSRNGGAPTTHCRSRMHLLQGRTTPAASDTHAGYFG